MRNLHKLLRKKTVMKQKMMKQTMKASRSAEMSKTPLSVDLRENVELFRLQYADSSDVVYRSFLIAKQKKATLVYIEGLSNIEEINLHILTPLMQETEEHISSIAELIESKITVSKTKEINSLEEGLHYLSNGNPILLFDGESHGIALGLTKWEKRAIEEPTAEVVLRGPREGFTESLIVNTSQLRRIIKSPTLRIQMMQIGGYTKTNVAIAYVEGLADLTLIDELKQRLSRIDIDGILESNNIEELIEDNPYSPFPQILSTERADVVSANLLEGRFALLVEGTPFVLIAPVTFFSFLQSSEDYYQRFLVGTAIRWLRYFFMGVALLLPSIYVAVLTFHQEMVPTALLISIASAREAVPFPAIVEVLIMEVTFEALREAGIRLPKQVGAAVSIVGALVIGQAAVQAGLVSAPMVIVVAITGISSFMMPRYVAGIAIRILRFPMILLAASLGLLGVILGLITIVVHLCSLRSFGLPYLSSVTTVNLNELKDVLLRAPLWAMNTRPRFTGESNKYRQATGQRPDPTRGDE